MKGLKVFIYFLTFRSSHINTGFCRRGIWAAQRRRGRARWLASASAVRQPRLAGARSRKRTRAGRSTSPAWLPNPILTPGTLLACQTGRSSIGLEPPGEAFCPSSALGFGKQRRLGDVPCQMRLSRASINHQKRFPRPEPADLVSNGDFVCASKGGKLLRLEALLCKPWQRARLSRCALYRR